MQSENQDKKKDVHGFTVVIDTSKVSGNKVTGHATDRQTSVLNTCTKSEITSRLSNAHIFQQNIENRTLSEKTVTRFKHGVIKNTLYS